jgi:phosphoesterase RecJ-like protein
VSGPDDLSVEAALGRAAEVIVAAPLVALACHVSPDGDALGSMLALHHVLRGRGTKASRFSEPFLVALAQLLPAAVVAPLTSGLADRFPREPAVMVTFDSGSLARLGDLEPAAKSADELIVVDHHVSNQRYGTINVIDPDAAASGVLVRRLIHELHLPLTRDAAVCLYAALVCDTGRFQYESTTAAVFDLARELMTYDVPVSELSRTLFEEHRFAYLQLLAEAVANAELVREQSFVWASVTQDMLSRHDVSVEEVDSCRKLGTRAVRGYGAEREVRVLGGARRTWRISLRSLGRVDVRHIAEPQGGGGHRFAAGFTSDELPEAIVAKIVGAL